MHPTNQLFHPFNHSVNPSIQPSHPIIHPSNYSLSICPSIHLFIHPFHPTKRLMELFNPSIHPSIHPSIQLFSLSIHFIQPFNLFIHFIQHLALQPDAAQCCCILKLYLKDFIMSDDIYTVPRWRMRQHVWSSQMCHLPRHIYDPTNYSIIFSIHSFQQSNMSIQPFHPTI